MKKIDNLIRKIMALAALPALALALATVANAQTYDSYGSGYGSGSSGSQGNSSYYDSQNGNSNDNYSGNMGSSGQYSSAPMVSIYSTDTDSVNLRVSYPQGSGMAAPVQVSIWNEDTNGTTTRSYSAMFDGQGMANVNVANLRTGTNYAFVVKVGTSATNFSSPSPPVGAKTL